MKSNKIFRLKATAILLTLIFGGLFLSSCSSDEEAPKLRLTTKEMIVALNEKIDYSDLVVKAKDNKDGDLKDKVTYKKIDTSKKGKQTIYVSVKDEAGNEAKDKIDVFVVKLFDDGSFDPRDIPAQKVANPSKVDVIVNKFHELDESYEPDDLETIIDRPDIKLRREANREYTKFYKEAKKRGISIYTISAYRSYNYQLGLWNNGINVQGSELTSKLIAYPGRSEHQLGLAIDISNTNAGDDILSETMGKTPLGKFIVKEAYKYGFVLRYPKDKVNITRYAYEPWHMRYVGKDLAKKLHDKGWTLEEYYDNK